MSTYTFSVIHLGNIADLDPVDGNGTAENQSALLGTYYGSGDPAHGHITTMTLQDTNSDGLINTNDTASPEAVSYDVGAGIVNTFNDGAFNVDVTVNFTPTSGEPAYTGIGGILQTETGDVFFVMIDDGEGFGSNAFDDAPIESITVNSVSAFGSQTMAGVSDTQAFVPCFATGTQVRTITGDKSVEKIAVGDQVATLDRGYRAVTWVGRWFLSAHHLKRHPKLSAICIPAGALGVGMPVSDLVLSPQHRVMLRSQLVANMTGHNEILVPVGKLAGHNGIEKLSCGLGIQYHHLAFATHEIIWANDALAESLLLGPQVTEHLNIEMQIDSDTLLKPTRKIAPSDSTTAVRAIIQRRPLIKRILARHVERGLPLVS